VRGGVYGGWWCWGLWVADGSLELVVEVVPATKQQQGQKQLSGTGGLGGVGER